MADRRDSILARLREARGMSLRDLAVATGYMVSHQTICAWETDPLSAAVPPSSIERVHALADALKVPRDDLAALLGLASTVDREAAEQRLRCHIEAAGRQPSTSAIRRADAEDYRTLLRNHCDDEYSDFDLRPEAREARSQALVGNISLQQRDGIARWLRGTNRDDIAHELERLADLDWSFKHPKEK